MTLDMLFEQHRREAIMDEKVQTILTMAEAHEPIELMVKYTRTTPDFVESVLRQHAEDGSTAHGSTPN